MTLISKLRHWLWRRRFRTKLNLGMAAVLLAMAGVLLPLVSHIAAIALLDQAIAKGEAMARILASRAREPLLADDYPRLTDMVDEHTSIAAVKYAFVLDAEGHVLAHTFAGGFPTDLLAANPRHTGTPLDSTGVRRKLLQDENGELLDDFAATVRLGDANLGEVRIGFSRAGMMAAIHRLLAILAALFAGTLLGAMALGSVFARRVTHRLHLLKAHAERLVRGDWDAVAGLSLAANCWQIQNCGLTSCPAHGDTRRRCWHLAGTLCPECGTGCEKCVVYRRSMGDELQDLTETFDVMALTLKTHLDELTTAERAMADQQRLLRAILDSTPDLVSLRDAELRYQVVNRSFAADVGHPAAWIEGKTDADLFDAQEAGIRAQLGREVLKAGVRRDSQVERAATETGSARWLHVVTVPIRDAEGETSGVLRTDRDVTDIKAYEKQLIQAQKMESLGQLAGGVAHEINTPLGVILGYAQLLQEDTAPESQLHQDLQTIEKQAQTCRKIVADLLGFSRHASSEKREMCFNNAVMEAIRLVRHTLSLDHVSIVEELDDRMPIIYGDPAKLKQVLVNLLNNARDAMAQDGGRIVVRTRLETPQQRVVLQVADTGKGIPQAAIKRVFEPFFTTKAVGQGTGLGLSISFGIIQEHGGDISVQSPVPSGFGLAGNADEDKGPGTLFTIHLPLDASTGQDISNVLPEPS